MRKALHPDARASTLNATAIIQLRRSVTSGRENNMALDIVIMAAGKGTRMKSRLPKVLHTLAGRSLLQHVLQTAASLGADCIITITGHGAEQVEAAVQAPKLQFVRQMPQLGTGHAVQQAVPALHDQGTTQILNGDVPLITAGTARALVEACGG